MQNKVHLVRKMLEIFLILHIRNKEIKEEEIMSSIDLIYRYLKAREKINDTYGALAAIIEVNKDENGISGIEAVEIEKDDVDLAKKLLSYSDLSSCFLNIKDKYILLYPQIEREKYMELQPFLAYGEEMIEYAGVTYSQASEMKSFMDAAGVVYKSMTDNDNKVKFMVPQNSKEIMQKIAEAVNNEMETEEGRKYLTAKNICLVHALNQASKAINGTAVAFIGREGGTGGIVIDEEGAVIMPAKQHGRFISRDDPKFEMKVINAILHDLNGVNTPVKSYFGDFAEILSGGMKKQDVYKTGLTMNQALDILGLEELPTINDLDDMFNNVESYNEKESDAFFTVARMVMCREQKLEGFDEYKLSKSERKKFDEMHQRYLDEFTKDKEAEHERG